MKLVQDKSELSLSIILLIFRGGRFTKKLPQKN